MLFSYLQVGGTTALMRATQGGYQDCAYVLLNHGARCDLCNANGQTAAALAIQNEHYSFSFACNRKKIIIKGESPKRPGRLCWS
jgi:ankyrin repeat protein